MPYIGVTGVKTPLEVAQLVAARDQLDPIWPEHYLLMVGTLVSRKTLYGEPPSDPDQYPQHTDIPSLLVDDRRLYQVAHFNTRDPWLFDQLVRLSDVALSAGARWDAIQLNLEWPSEAQLHRFRHSLPASGAPKIILQIGSEALSQIGNRPEWLPERIMVYHGLVDAVLLDASGGTGQALDVEFMARALSALKDTHPPYEVGVAGGLDSTSVGKLAPLIKEWPGLSWDAQGKMRHPDARQHLDPRRCLKFLQASCELIKVAPAQ